MRRRCASSPRTDKLSAAMGEETRRGPVTGRTWVMLVVVVLAARALGIALGLAIDWFPAQGSTIAHKIDTFWDVLVIVSVPIFVVVTTVVLFSIWRWHMRPGRGGPRRPADPRQHDDSRSSGRRSRRSSSPALCAYATVLLLDIQESPAKGTRVVNVTGQQFAWTFATARAASGIKTNRLVRPGRRAGPVQGPLEGRPPRLLGAGVAPEGRRRARASRPYYTLTPTKTGRFQVVCAELCGLGPRLHAPERLRRLAGRLRGVASPASRSPPPPPAAGGGAGAGGGAAAADGKQLFVAGNPQTGALACGSLPHAGGRRHELRRPGPNLDAALKARRRGRDPRDDRRSRTRRSRRDSARTSCRRTTGRR